MFKAIAAFFRFSRPADVREAAGEEVDDRAWRPISQTKRDLPPITQQRMQELAHHAWEQHRIANRLIELPIAFILGDGVKIEIDDEEMQAWLDAWWRDPINRLDLRLEQRVRELALFGEQIIVAFVRNDGLVRYGAIDPSAIDDVIVDPDNAALPIGVRINLGDGRKRTYRVILDGEDADLLRDPAIRLRETMVDGECHFWRVNDLLTGKRGRSDLLSAVDLADAYSQLIYGEVERAVALRAVIWDVTLRGATPEQVEKRARDITPPAPMSVRVHNEGEEWSVLSAQLGSTEAAETLRAVRNEVLGGGTIPEHWFGGGGDVNRATAAEMDEPTYRVFRRRQILWAAILEAEARHAVRERLKALGLQARAGAPEFQPRAVFPSMQSIDMSRYAAALAQVVSAMAGAVTAQLLSRETAVRIIAAVAAKFGVEIDAEAELAKALKDAETAAGRDLFTPPQGFGATDPIDPGGDPAAPDPAEAAA